MQKNNPQPFQLDLFSWDKNAVGEGYECLAGFDFQAATACFSKVIRLLPDHADARRGLDVVNYWQAVLQEAADLNNETTYRSLWEKIKRYRFAASEGDRQLRQALTRHLLQLMDGKDSIYVPPDLCSGCLHLQLGDFGAAEKSLRILLERLPGNGRLWGYLADALYAQGRTHEARSFYVKALLLAPDEVSVWELRDQQLRAVISEHTAAWAPFFGFFDGVLPLVEQEGEPRTQEARAYRFLQQSEQARLQGGHDRMIAARRSLKDLFPEVLTAYLDWLSLQLPITHDRTQTPGW